MKNLKKLKKLFTIWIFFFSFLNFTKANPIPTPEWPNAGYMKCIQIENVGEIIPWYTSFFVLNDHSKINDKYIYVDQFVKTDDYECITPPLFFIDTNKKDINQINTELKNNDKANRKEFLESKDIVLPIPHEYAWWYVVWRRKGVMGNNSMPSNIMKSIRSLDMDIIYRIERDWTNLTAKKIQEHKYENKDSDIINYDDSPIIYSTDVKTYFSEQKSKKIKNNIKQILSKDPSIYQSYFSKFCISWIETIILETIMLFFICKIFYKKDNIKSRKILLTGLVASSVTLPILWFILPTILNNYLLYAIFGEIFVTAVEVIIIKYLLKISRKKAIIASVCCNLFSVLIWLAL